MYPRNHQGCRQYRRALAGHRFCGKRAGRGQKRARPARRAKQAFEGGQMPYFLAYKPGSNFKFAIASGS